MALYFVEQAHETGQVPTSVKALKNVLVFTILLMGLGYYALYIHFKYKTSQKLQKDINSWNENAALNGSYLTAVPNYTLSHIVDFSTNLKPTFKHKFNVHDMALDFFSSDQRQSQIFHNENFI